MDIHPGTRELGSVAGELRFEDVSFRYDEDAWTLRDISLEVPAGTRTAIVGETGSGKTTLGYLAARLYDPARGRVVIDGVDIRDLTFSSLADVVGVVSQETYLFHASVRENLRFARPDASDEEIEEAARAAQIHDTIAGLPDGYDTVVGERGFRFSGGEKQRIAIARTVLRNPPVLVLDEATSALDVQTERAVEQALVRLAEGRTTIVIAHRLSTVRGADQIVVLDQGEIVERGTHSELLARGGKYAAMVARDEGALEARRQRPSKGPAAPLAPAGDARAAAGRQACCDLAGTGPKAASPPEDDLNRAAEGVCWTLVQGRSVDHHGGRAEHDHAAVRGLVAHAGGRHAADHHLRRAHHDRVRRADAGRTCRPRARPACRRSARSGSRAAGSARRRAGRRR